MIIFRGDKSRISFCDSRNKNRRGFLNVLILNQNYQVWLVVHISISIVVALIHFFINLIFKSRLEIPNIQFKSKEVINKCKFFNWIKAYPIWRDRREHWGVDGNRKSSDLNCSKYFPARCAFILPLHSEYCYYRLQTPVCHTIRY